MPSLEPITQFSKEVAFRITLATKVLPQVSPKTLIEGLQTHLGTEISEESLDQLTIPDLKTILSNITEENELSGVEEAVPILRGETANYQDWFPIEEKIEDSQSIQVAIASNNPEKLDGHFGSCDYYLIYQLTPETMRLIDVRLAIESDLAKEKTAFRVNLIKDCEILYLVSIGGPAAAKVVHANIYPLKKEEGGEAREFLAQLQSAIALSPPPWLAKIFGVRANERLKNYGKTVTAED
ncbi:MAG: NifB/NifX family molybdenum-iron cluster-binding protein [Halothece sp.]